MKLKSLTIVILIVSLISCKKSSPPEKDNTLSNTPEALNNSQEINWGKFSKSYRGDIISKLYAEALEKNLTLKNLNDQIEIISEMKRDSVYGYQNFSSTNSNYWSSAENYLLQIKDSTLRSSANSLFQKLESKYYKSMENHSVQLREINKNTVLINDHLIVLKLLTSAQMMKAYQENEVPDKNSLLTLKQEQENVLIKIKKHLNN